MPRPTLRTTSFLTAALSGLAASALAIDLTWDADPATAGAQAGSGDWNTTSARWWNGSATIAWPNTGADVAHLDFASSAATVKGNISAAGLAFAQRQQVKIPQSTTASANALLTVTGNVGAGLLSFSGKIGSGRYDPLLLNSGLRFSGGAKIEVLADIALVNTTSSPSLQVIGPGTEVRYRGRWNGDEGGTFTSLALREGGRWIIAADAFVDLVGSGGGFTRQLWVYGDGTGGIELEEGFVADRSLGGTVPEGLGSIRISNTTVTTHASQSLPLTIRLAANGDTQQNGHFVFENEAGGIWRTMTNPQTYTGALWLGVNMTIDAQTAITHTGITTFLVTADNQPYTAANAFQTTADNVTVTKSGPARLTLAGEIAFRAGGVLAVTNGSVDMRTNPAAGMKISNGGVAGPNMQLAVSAGAWARFGAPLSSLARITNHGRVVLQGGVAECVGTGTGFSQSATGVLAAALGPHGGGSSSSRLSVGNDAAISGTIEVTRLPGYRLAAGTAWDVVDAGSLTAPGLVLDDRTGLSLTLEVTGTKVRVLSSIATPGVWFGYDVWVGDHFPQPQWDNSALTGPTVSSPATGWPNLVTYALDLGENVAGGAVAIRFENPRVDEVGLVVVDARVWADDECGLVAKEEIVPGRIRRDERRPASIESGDRARTAHTEHHRRVGADRGKEILRDEGCCAVLDPRPSGFRVRLGDVGVSEQEDAAAGKRTSNAQPGRDAAEIDRAVGMPRRSGGERASDIEPGGGARLDIERPVVEGGYVIQFQHAILHGDRAVE